MAEPSQRLAPGAHSLFRLWIVVSVAPRDPDVFSQRSVVCLRPDPAVDSRRTSARAPGLHLRSRIDDAGVGARISLRHRVARPPLDSIRAAHLMDAPPIATPSQTVGPFFQVGLAATDALGSLAGPDTPGERLTLRLRVVDGDGVPVPDCLVEIYQADASGTYGRAPFS